MDYQNEIRIPHGSTHPYLVLVSFQSVNASSTRNSLWVHVLHVCTLPAPRSPVRLPWQAGGEDDGVIRFPSVRRHFLLIRASRGSGDEPGRGSIRGQRHGQQWGKLREGGREERAMTGRLIYHSLGTNNTRASRDARISGI